MKWIALMAICLFSVAGSALAGVEGLLGRTVVYAGHVQKVECPRHSVSECADWPDDLYKFTHERFCFRTPSYECTLYCSGFMTVRHGDDHEFHVVSRSSVSSDVATLYQCPAMH